MITRQCYVNTNPARPGESRVSIYVFVQVSELQGGGAECHALTLDRWILNGYETSGGTSSKPTVATLAAKFCLVCHIGGWKTGLGFEVQG